jgi:PmbA protein
MLSIVDDPTDARSIGANRFDGEGLACRRNVLIENGVLTGFLHDAASASRAGTASTASAVRGYRSTPTAGAQAMVVRPGAGDTSALVSHIPDGLLVTSMAGLHSGVNPVSGDFSVGADGIRIRGGELAEPVREITLASTVQRMLLDIDAVGADLEWLPSGTGGVTLVIRDTAMSGH